MLGRSVFALVVAIAGCDRVLGIDDLPRRTGPEPPTFASRECEGCEHNNCSAPALACDRDPTCAVLHRCLARCTVDDAQCRASCEAGEPAYRSNAPYDSLDACRRKSCRATCLGDSSLAKLLPPGCECLTHNCREAGSACLTSEKRDGMTGDCERGYACMASEGISPDTLIHCVRKFAAGGPEIISVSQCWARQACPACPSAGERNFSCVGKYQWRETLVLKPRFMTTVISDEGKTVAGAKVDACIPTFCASCGHEPASTFSSGVSGADGVVMLDLPRGFAGCLHAEHPDYLHMQQTIGRPVVEDEAPKSLETIGLAKPATIDLLLASIGAKRDPNLAQVIVTVRDCNLSPSPGVVLEALSDGTARVVYGRGTGFSLEPPTDGSGLIAIASLAPGFVSLRARIGSTIVSEWGFHARPGHLHDVRMLPKPR